MSFTRLLAVTFATVLAAASRLSAQNPAPNAQDTTSGDLPRVFLDCQSNGCDFDFFRTELTWMNFVRDRNLARVHILVTSRSTSSGGSEITVALMGQGDLAARSDSVVQFIPQGATGDDSRRIVARTIAQGMIRFVRDTPLAARLTVNYRAPTGVVVSATRGARDPWHLWVFRISTSGFTNGDANASSASVNGSFRASRTTADWKANISFGGNYRESHFDLSDTETFSSYQHGWNSDWLLVKSLDQHWSLGGQISATNSVFSNQDLALRIGPALEFDIFPYAQSTRRQVILRYSPGARLLNYRDTTIYEKVKEKHFDHRFLIAAEVTQPWGSIFGSSSFNQLLDDPSKSSLDFNAFVSWRIVTGLNLNIGGGYTRIRDQLNLRKGASTDEDILLRLRQLRTGYSYYGNVGLSYTFGSIFQNVVNPRFSQNGGGGFFFF